jgi:nucleoid-associated protein YgaU
LIALLVTGALAVGATSGPTRVRLPITVASDTYSVIVERGDHLWKISANHLRSELGREARDAEIWPYWLVVIETNRSELRSGDPDLIYPGEVIDLPPHGP